MQTKTLTIKNKLGLHARASSQLMKTASRFQSEITIKFNDRTVDAKSIIDLLTLGASQGKEVELAAEGEDEQAAMDAVVTLINDRFGEEE